MLGQTSQDSSGEPGSLWWMKSCQQPPPFSLPPAVLGTGTLPQAEPIQLPGQEELPASTTPGARGHTATPAGLSPAHPCGIFWF